MGYASFMVTVRQGINMFPTAYFFHDHDLAKKFYESMLDMHTDGDSYTASVQLWTLNEENNIWELTTFN